MPNLFIASELRSGSTYIAEAISYSLFDSFGSEWWDLAKEKFSMLDNGSTDRDVVSIMETIYINQIGFRCAKLMIKDLSYVFRVADESAEVYDYFFGPDTAWIIIKRRNRIRQAVSLAFARESGLFHFYNNEINSTDRNIDVNIEQVKDSYLKILAAEDYLTEFKNTISRGVVVYYEDFLESPLKEMKRIFSKIEMPLNYSNITLSKVKLQKTAQLRKQYMEKIFAKYLLRNGECFSV